MKNIFSIYTILNWCLIFSTYWLLGTLFSLVLTSYRLFKEIGLDTSDPSELCKKINYTRTIEYSTHLIFFFTLIARGWFIEGALNFPFLFYNFSQWFESRYIIDSDRVFSIIIQEMRIIKIKALFCLGVTFYYVWNWLTWVTPVYVKAEEDWNCMRIHMMYN